MSVMSKHHQELKDGKGKCSVPMWIDGCPAGFCDNDAFGKYIDGERYPREHWIKPEMRGKRSDGKYDGYVPGLACVGHGGPKCPGIEIEPNVFSGCNQSHGDCPTCGK